MLHVPQFAMPLAANAWDTTLAAMCLQLLNMAVCNLYSGCDQTKLPAVADSNVLCCKPFSAYTGLLLSLAIPQAHT
jgi:hypothetical protein